MYYRANALPKRKFHFGFWLGFACVLAFMLGWAIEGWGHSVNDTITGYEWQDYDCEHRMHYGYDIHHEHTTGGDDWHWHKHARNDNGDLLESYINEHEHDSDYNRNHADAWTSMGCSNEENADREDSGNNPNVPPAEMEVITPEKPITDPPPPRPPPIVDDEIEEPETPTPPLPPQETPAPAPQKAEQKRSITQRLRESGASEEVIEEMTEQPSEPQHVPRNPTCDTDFSVSGIICYNWQIEDRYQLIGFPVLPSFGIDDIGWLHYFFEWKLERHNLLFQVFVDGRWLSFTGGGRNEANPGVGDIPITPHLAVMVNFKRSEESIGVLGTPQQGQIINLEPGIHLIGLPEVPQNYQRASDLVAVDGIEWVRIGYASSIFIDSEDDTDDRDLVKGQAVRMSVTEPVTLDLRGTAPAAAPMAPRRGTLATSWGGLKRIP